MNSTRLEVEAEWNEMWRIMSNGQEEVEVEVSRSERHERCYSQAYRFMMCIWFNANSILHLQFLILSSFFIPFFSHEGWPRNRLIKTFHRIRESTPQLEHANISPYHRGIDNVRAYTFASESIEPPCKVMMTGMGANEKIPNLSCNSNVNDQISYIWEKKYETRDFFSKFPYFIVHHQVSIKICKIPSQFFVVSRAVHIYIV